MSKKAISHRYAIEYTQPTTSEAASRRFRNIWLFFIIFSALAFVSWSYLKSDNFSYNFKELSSNALEAINGTENNNNSKNSNQFVSNDNAKETTKIIEEDTPPAIVKRSQEEELETTIAVKKSVKTTLSTTNPSSNTINRERLIKTSATKENIIKVVQTTKAPAIQKASIGRNASELAKEIPLPATSKNDDSNSFENNALIDSLNQLTEQLSIERKKTTVLETKIQENEDNNNNLSQLLKDSLHNSNTKNDQDKAYITALKGLDKNQQAPNNTAKNTTIEKSKKTEAIVATEAIKLELKNSNNSISLGMKQQVDAILLAMQEAKNLSRRNQQNAVKPNIAKTTGLQTQNNDLISQISQQMDGTSAADNTNTDSKSDLITTGLQDKINQLSKSNSQSDYEKALSSESKVRSNAVRSIIVRKGETLWSIAKRAYGDGKHYKKILAANPQITKNKTVRLVIGQVIRVPK